ncbi:Amidase [Rhodomicrobium vannielii ATCC 17100]|uniref:Indoleacetamide hydrolase n=1 Tax=Rhodomicrobium vannielii (strain ATCC 17100 / DSM 162 / LMG 4299 / NCIMB 10020 / ATH 3.1.1) TaxID=648757 RepID=E3I6W8_RHOVT|nr:amidase [Rhodomicrobium vannielii]ADP71836.1 Amidase [Rhodomicrobium vannielii ATCC 17100]
MSGFADYDAFDGVGLAELVRRREVSAGELLAEARARADAVNPALNAIVYRRDAEAAREADAVAPDAPLAGVPFLVKDLGSPLAGAPLTCGSKLFANYVPDHDGEIVKRFKRAGLIAFGKTNVPEFGLVPVTEPVLFGPCRNPWDTERTPGGSSGGAAAAVAAGVVPMAHATDGGGSIRIPASCCGLVGLKTSRGLNPVEPFTPDYVVDHVVSRTVRDSAAALDATCGRADAGFLAGLDAPPPRLRIAVVRSAMLAGAVSPVVKTALDEAARLLASLGHHVEDAEPALDYDAFASAFLIEWATGARFILDKLPPALIGRAATKDDVEFGTWTLTTIGGHLMSQRAEAQATLATESAKLIDFFTRYDVLLSPVLATPPLRISEAGAPFPEKTAAKIADAVGSPERMRSIVRAVARKSFAFAAFSAPFNMSGQPAISVPLCETPDGLPIGMQFAARIGDDGLLLRLARELEQAAPWGERRPRVWSGASSRQPA